MQSSPALGRQPRPEGLLTRLTALAGAFTVSMSLRVAAATSGGRGLPTHLIAASYRGSEGAVTAHAPAPEEVEEEIDPEIVTQVRLAQDGNAHAFSVLYDRYVDRVYGYCYHRVGNRQTAEDLTADVFMRALKRIDSFTWQGKDFGAWLITIARNRCHDHFKSARFRMENPVADVFDSAEGGPAYDARPEHNLEVEDLRTQLRAGLERLKSEHAEVLFHRFLQGFDVESTAAIMGKKPGAIRALQYRALKALAKHVDLEALL